MAAQASELKPAAPANPGGEAHQDAQHGRTHDGWLHLGEKRVEHNYCNYDGQASAARYPSDAHEAQ